MSNSVLRTRQLSTGNGKYYQSKNTLLIKNKGKTQYIVLPKEVGKELRNGEYEHLEYKVNDLTHEVFLIFSKTASSYSIEVNLIDSNSENATRKLTIRSQCVVEFLVEDLSLSGEIIKCAISDNISNKSDFATYKVTKE